MKVFISWSGNRSRAVAAALTEWLPHVIQVVRPFFSPEIEKGARWSGELDVALAGTSFGIVCLTSDNHTSPWLHYEAGALSKTADALVWTFLLDVSPGDVGQPLGRFQHTMPEKPDVLKLVRTINRRLADVGGQPLGEQFLIDTFETHWPWLETRLGNVAVIAAAPKPAVPAPPDGRLDRELLKEILELLRAGSRSPSSRDTSTDRLGSARGAEPMIARFSDDALRRLEDHVENLAHRLLAGERATHAMLSEIQNLLRPSVAYDGAPERMPSRAYRAEDEPTAQQPDSR